jgi:pimeloyl-ACP methyl ester carboxylesterase
VIRFLLHCLALATALIALPASAQDDHMPEFRMEVIQLTGDAPGKIREAPGGGRVLVPGVLYTPASGANVHGPAIVMLDAGPGDHPLGHDQITRFAAERLAAQGYTVLSLYGYQERSFALIKFAETVWPIESALTFLENAGYEDFALAGQGYGAIAAAQYLATRPDTLLDNGGQKRVRALILYNPVTNLRKYPRAMLDGSGYAAKVARAEASVASGRGLIPTNLEPGQAGSSATDPWVASGPFVAPAEAFLDYWGPKAAARNAALLAAIAVPTLALVDPGDGSTSRDFAIKAPLEFAAVGGGEAGYAATAMRIAQFLAAQNLAPRPTVVTSTIDAATGGGRVLPGVLYTPAGGAKPGSPTIMLLFGRSTDALQSSTHWMGWRLAQQGYTVIAPSLRIGGAAGFESSSLAEVNEDLSNWLDVAEKMVTKCVVLGGHSNGGIWLSNYLALTHDPRVIGTIYYAPTRDSPTYTAQHQTPASYAADVAFARKSVKAGRGMEDVVGLLTTHAFMDNNAPGARTMHTQRVQEFSLPGFMITGAKDPLMDEAFVAQFAKVYKGPLTQVRYPNGTHGLRENKDRVAIDTAAWLEKTFP